jgi:hypothetical protein
MKPNAARGDGVNVRRVNPLWGFGVTAQGFERLVVSVDEQDVRLLRREERSAESEEKEGKA